MIRLILILLVLTAPVARAEVARVTSGEHDGYSRLLVTAPRVDGWQMARTADGYALDAGAGTTGFDLSRAFDRIPRTRITALFADPQDGTLRIRVGCACHAIAFLHEGRYLVVDVRDGEAPARSAFERGLDGTRLPALPADDRVVVPAAAAGYNWLADWRGDALPEPLPPEGAAPLRGAGAEDLRRALMAGLARGAAAGVIGLTLPGDGPVAMPAGVVLFNGGAPGVAMDSDPGDNGPGEAAGIDCPDNDRFDLGAWATDAPYVLQFGHHRAALLGEFDRPDPSAVDTGVRFYLHLGFGAEAADLIRAFPDSIGDPQIWSMMAAILDGQPVADPAVADWMRCDTAAVLWATLALPPDAAGMANRQALRQAFSTLPPHLRVLLTPALRERALLLDDAELGASIAASADRGVAAPPDDTAPASLLSAWRDGGGDAVPAALAFVAAAHSDRAPVPAEVPGALLALAEDYHGLPEAEGLARAGRLAAALAGDLETAFADPARAADMPEIWQLLVDSADDDTFIAIAIAQSGAFPPGHPELAEAFADRFLDLRLPELALEWMPTQPGDNTGSATAAAALVDLGRGREALAWLDGLPEAETADLRARAADLAGEHALAAEAWAAAGDPDRAARSARLAGDPAELAATSAWQRLTDDAAGAPRPRATEGTGPLQDAGALVAASAGLRADIGVLLNDTALPASE
jgi:hypothetical protein